MSKMVTGKKEHFRNFRFLIIESAALDGDELIEIKQILTSYGAEQVIVKNKDDDNNKTDENVLLNLTHIVAADVEFPEYAFADANMIPVVTPSWIHKSISLGRLMSLRPYLPDPKYFLKNVFIAVAGIPDDDRDALVAAVVEHGGQYDKNVTKFTTHVISMDIYTTACGIALLIPNIDIKCVLPHWIDDCLKLRQKIDETPYLLDNITIPFVNNAVETDQLSPNTKLDSSSTDIGNIATSLFLKNKSFYLSHDLLLGQRLANLVITLIEANGGSVIPSISDSQTLVPDDLAQTCYIGKYRAGHDYINASKANYMVGNLTWLFWMLAHSKFAKPTDNLLHYPVSKEGLPEFRNLTFSGTNYTGDGRRYLETLIIAIGGKFSRTLHPKVDYLICAKPVGQKYEAAQKWDTVKIRNHRWIEDCYKQWTFLNDGTKKYCDILGNSSPEMLLGYESFDEESVRKFYDPKAIPTVSKASLGDFYKENENSAKKGNSKPIIVDNKSSPTTDKNEQAIPIKTSGRKAAIKAAVKLHSDMEDLNVFQKQRSRNGTPKLPEEVVREKESKRKSISSQDSPNKKSKTDGESLKIKKKLKSPSPLYNFSFNFRVITTGCDDASRFDSQILESIGIHMEKDPLRADVIVAPRIMRTEKFLTALGNDVKHILHPDFLNDVIQAFKQKKLSDFDVQQYHLDKYDTASTSELHISLEQLLIKASNRASSGNKLFKDMAFNISNHVPGGQLVINRIMSAHGLNTKVKLIKSPAALKTIKQIEVGQNTTDCYLITARPIKNDKSDNGRLIERFRSVCKENGKTPKVVEWNWVVASIFSMDTEGHKKFLIA